MKIRGTILITSMVLVIAVFWSVQVGAYGLFTADPPESSRCSQCHVDWPGATHTVHMGFDCGACHVEEDPVATSSCSACHPAADVLTVHSPLEAPGDQNYCGYCHAGTDNVQKSLGGYKALFK